MGSKINGLVIVFVLAAATAAMAEEEPRLSLPLDCGPVTSCWTSRLFDHDPGPRDVDWRCGPRASGNHDGIDIAPVDPKATVRVLAAAAGVVLGVRNDMPDVNVLTTGAAAVQNHECGNGLVIDHGHGWQTQYCHLRRGTVSVRSGSAVSRGQELGQVGLSGLTELPHLHLTLRHDGHPVDPFTGTGQDTGCGVVVSPLWDAAALAALPYESRHLYLTGFAAVQPEKVTARAGGYLGPLPADAPALILWADMMAPRAGDVVRQQITGPDGHQVLSRDTRIDKDHVQWFGYVGVKRRLPAWPTGRYLGRVTVLPADGGPSLAQETTIDVR